MSRVSQWVAGTIAGFLIFGSALHFPGSLDNDPWAPSAFVLGALTGFLVGALQLFALRGALSRPWLWPIATAVGIAITHGLGDGMPTSAGYLSVAFGGGIATGVLQAMLVRQPWWAVAATSAFVVGIVGGWSIAVAAGVGSIFEEDWLPQHAIMSGLTGVLYAASTAPLFTRIRPENTLPILASDGAA